MAGFQTALHEITLVLFTTLAPASVFACVLIALLLAFGGLETKESIRVQHMAVLPLVLAMVGLVASATHLGTPSNALYVLTGIGRSPLSNEVAAAIAFLGSSGLCWLYSFALKPHAKVLTIWNTANAVTGIACITMIALAYSEPTILTWNTWHVPANIWLSALAGGPLIALLTLRYAHKRFGGPSFARALMAVGIAAIILSGTVLISQMYTLGSIRNGVGTADALVRSYPMMIGAYLACLTGAYAVTVRAVLRAGQGEGQRDAEVSLGALATGSLVFFAGLFVVRFGFYMMHMTAGIGL